MNDGDAALVSVCVPTYNMARFLRECIESVLAQTWQNWELVICDDLSTDETPDLCRMYAARDARIKYIVNEGRLGMFENFRRTAAHARGAYLKFLCADDWLDPACLEVCLHLMQRHPSAALVAAACLDVNASGNPIARVSDYVLPRRFYRGAQVIRRQMLGLRAIGGNSSFFVRRSAYERVGGYDVSFRYAADNHLGLRLCQVGDFLCTTRPLFYGRHHGEQSSHRSDEDLAPVRDWLSIPGAILGGAAPLAPSWWLLRFAVGRVVADHLLVAGFRFLRGRWGSGMRLAGFVIRRGRPWWPAIVLAPVRAVVLTWRGLRRRTRSIGAVPVWRPTDRVVVG